MIRSVVLASVALLSTVAAQIDPRLVGTWTTKSRKVFTGPGFYDPVNDKLKEPDLTGISYSFTADGHYETAYYRAAANPTSPECPQAVMQWQHGAFTQHPNGSLTLNPIAVDGRSLTSSPCDFDQSIYMRYHQWELFERFEVFTDKFHGILRLNLYRFDGSPMNPMYLAYSPPQMLPTQTLNPTTSSGAGAKATGSSNQKRSFDDTFTTPLNARALKDHQDAHSPDKWWWIGVGMIGFGSIAYFLF